MEKGRRGRNGGEGMKEKGWHEEMEGKGCRGRG